MQPAGDDGASPPLLMERVEPGTPLALCDHAHLHGSLGAAIRHVAVETLPLGLERKEPARPDVHETRALEERWQLADEPAVDGHRIRRRGDDAASENTIRMCEGGHVGIVVEDPKTPTRPQDSNKFGDGSLSSRNVG